MRKISNMAVMAATVLCALGLSVHAEPEIMEIGAEEQLVGGFYRFAVACDRLDQPHVVAQVGYNGGASQIWTMYDRVNGQWQSSTFNFAAYYQPAAEFVFPHIEVDPVSDQAWISGVGFGAGIQAACAMACIVRNNVSTAPSGVTFKASKVNTSVPLGNLSLAPNVHDRAYMYVNFGYLQEQIWANGIQHGTTVSTLLKKNCSERILYGFEISKAPKAGYPSGVWHASYVGHPGLSGYGLRWNEYQNNVRENNGQGYLIWGDPGTYPGHEEHNYGALGTDNVNPEAAYFAVYGENGFIYVNMYDGNGLAYPANNMLRFPSSKDSGARRYPPSITAAKGGGAWLCYVNGGYVTLVFIEADGSHGSPIQICPGVLPAAATDSKGDIHIAYYNATGGRYRKIDVAGGSGGYVRAKNFDGAGGDDLAVYHSTSASWYLRTPAAWALPQGWGFAGVVPVPGEYDGTKGADLAVFDPTTEQWYIRTLDLFSAPVDCRNNDCIPVSLDYNGDGIDDLGTYSETTGFWMIDDIQGNQLLPQAQWGFQGCVPVPGQYDNNPGDDLAVYETASGQWFIGTAELHATPIQWGFAGCIPVPGDYNGDGRTDPAVYMPATGDWWILTAEFYQAPINWGYQGCVPVPMDYDGNGVTDMAVYDRNSGNWYVLTAWPQPQVLCFGENWGWAEASVLPIGAQQ